MARATRTDEQITSASRRRQMVVSMAGWQWAMETRDALLLLDIFTRARRVEQVHTSSYSETLYVSASDQSPPIDGCMVGDVEIEPIRESEVDKFTDATRSVA